MFWFYWRQLFLFIIFLLMSCRILIIMSLFSISPLHFLPVCSLWNVFESSLRKPFHLSYLPDALIGVASVAPRPVCSLSNAHCQLVPPEAARGMYIKTCPRNFCYADITFDRSDHMWPCFLPLFPPSLTGDTRTLGVLIYSSKKPSCGTVKKVKSILCDHIYPWHKSLVN